MIIEKLSSLTVKITLNDYELDFFGLNYELLKNNDSSTKKLITYILDEIKNNININLFNEHLYIEAFSGKHKHCILYISVIYINDIIKMDNIRYCSDKIIIVSECIRSLIKYSCILSENHIFPESNLFLLQNRYLLIIYDIISSDPELPERTAANCGLEYYTDEILKASAEEYGNCIISGDAVGILSGKILF